MKGNETPAEGGSAAEAAESTPLSIVVHHCPPSGRWRATVDNGAQRWTIRTPNGGRPFGAAANRDRRGDAAPRQSQRDQCSRARCPRRSRRRRKAGCGCSSSQSAGTLRRRGCGRSWKRRTRSSGSSARACRRLAGESRGRMAAHGRTMVDNDGQRWTMMDNSPALI